MYFVFDYAILNFLKCNDKPWSKFSSILFCLYLSVIFVYSWYLIFFISFFLHSGQERKNLQAPFLNIEKYAFIHLHKVDFVKRKLLFNHEINRYFIQNSKNLSDSLQRIHLFKDIKTSRFVFKHKKNLVTKANYTNNLSCFKLIKTSIKIEAMQDIWVEAKQAGGDVIFSDLIPGNQVKIFIGIKPIELLIGNAHGLAALFVDEKRMNLPLGLKSISVNQVQRFIIN